MYVYRVYAYIYMTVVNLVSYHTDLLSILFCQMPDAWFLEISFVREVSNGVCVYVCACVVCMCVRPPGY